MQSLKLERLPDVLARVGLSRSVLYRMVAAREFPKPVKLGARIVAWDSGAVDRWIRGRVSAT